MQAGKQRTKPSFPEPFLDVITPMERAIASPNDNLLKTLAQAALGPRFSRKNFTIEGAPMQFGVSLPVQNKKGTAGTVPSQSETPMA